MSTNPIITQVSHLRTRGKIVILPSRGKSVVLPYRGILVILQLIHLGLRTHWDHMAHFSPSRPEIAVLLLE